MGVAKQVNLVPEGSRSPGERTDLSLAEMVSQRIKGREGLWGTLALGRVRSSRANPSQVHAHPPFAFFPRDLHSGPRGPPEPCLILDMG